MKGEYVRVIEISNLEQSAKEIARLGVSYSSAAKMSEGFISRVLKISGIDVREINIVRGEALRVGMSAAVADDTLLLTAAKGELLICGTLLPILIYQDFYCSLVFLHLLSQILYPQALDFRLSYF